MVFFVLQADLPARAANRNALVIGNSQYSSAPLTNPANDARDVKAALEKLGFDVTLKIDAGRSALRRAVRVFGDKIRKGGVGLFYYSGHGVQMDGVNYMIPVGIDIQRKYDVEDQCLKMGYVLGAMEEASNALNIVILDACRDNPFRSFRGGNKGLARMDAPNGTIIAYATGAGKVAADGDGRNGTYTAHLLKHLGRKDLTVHQMLNRTGLDVMAETKKAQVPWISSTPIEEYYLAKGFTVVDTPHSTQPETGRLKVLSSPSGADIQVDGTARGRAPVDISGLSAGLYRVTGSLNGHESTEKSIQVNAGRKAVLTLYLDPVNQKARLFVHSTPADSQVRILNIVEKYHDGIGLDSGRYQIEVSREGYATDTRWISVSGTDGADLYVELEKAGSEAGDTWTEPVTGLEFVWVPKGCFQMGQTEKEKQYLIKDTGEETYRKYFQGELPRHQVCVDGFWMATTEVTRGQFRKFVRDTGYRTDADKKGNAFIFNKETDWKWKEKKGFNWEKVGYNQTDTHPVVTVSWNDARAFSKWIGKKSGRKCGLPSEAQWEYAARAGTTTMRYWGDNDSQACRYANAADKGSNWSNAFPCDDGHQFTAPVHSFQPNNFGLYDMLGNAWEWCQDVYDKNAYGKHSISNPASTSGSSARVLRGGGWDGAPGYCRAADRYGSGPSGRLSNLGFRLVLLSGQ